MSTDTLLACVGCAVFAIAVLAVLEWFRAKVSEND